MNLGYQGSLDEAFQPQPIEIAEKKQNFFNRRLLSKKDQPRSVKDIIPNLADRPTDNYGANIPLAEPVNADYYRNRNEPIDRPTDNYRTRNEPVDRPTNYHRTQNEPVDNYHRTRSEPVDNYHRTR